MTSVRQLTPQDVLFIADANYPGWRANVELPREDHMVDLGLLDAEGARQEYRQADVLLFPSRLEASGLPRQGAGLAHEHAAHRLAETLQGEVLQPVAYQAVPLEAAPLMELAAE